VEGTLNNGSHSVQDFVPLLAIALDNTLIVLPPDINNKNVSRKQVMIWWSRDKMLIFHANSSQAKPAWI
jgi:hypothetical protein